MFAIVKISGKQYKVEKDAVLEVDHIDGQEGDTVVFTDVLLKATDKDVELGNPVVAQAKVTAKIVKQMRGEKIEVRRYKHKVRTRRHIGFRAELTQLQITAIA